MKTPSAMFGGVLDSMIVDSSGWYAAVLAEIMMGAAVGVLAGG
jgi:hypothetical protein